MAITRLQDFYPTHARRVVAAVVLLQASLLAILALLLIGAGVDTVTIAVYFLLPVAVLQLFAFYIIGRYALEPLNILTRTITHISDQPNTSIPANLNGTRHEKTGLKLMVETLYGLALKNPHTITAEEKNQGMYFELLEKLPGGVIALDESRSIIYANSAAPITTDINGTKQIQLTFEDDQTLEQWLTIVESSQLRADKIWRRIQNVRPGESDRKVYDVSVSYQKNSPNGADTLILLFDQTKHYAVNEEAMDFMALAAHELRGPITVIRGYLDILRSELDATLNADQKQLFDRLDVSSSRLSGYISNVLNASKFDRRHLQLHLREDRVSDVFSLVLDDLSLRASTQGRLLNVAIPADLPTIAADRNSLSEVMANLVDNGIKYSQEGGQVIVTAAVDGDFVRFSVQDFGIGIPAAIVGNLFSKFYRSHRSKGTVTGTGLGLYISKAIVESHGGKVSLTSTEGEGSVFSFSVPIYSTVAEKLLQGDDQNKGIIETSSGWIKNHSMYRG